MIRPPFAARLHAVKLESVCSQCARRLLYGPQRGNGSSQRSFTNNVRHRQLAVTRGAGLERTYFWTNAIRGRQQEQAAWEDGHSTGLKVGSTSPARTTYNAAQQVEQGSPIADTEEPPHRRRKRLKQQAAAEEVLADSPLPPDASAALSHAASAAPPRSLKRLLSVYLSLSKPRLGFLVMLTTTAAYATYPVPALLSTSATAAPSLSTLTLAFLTSGTFLQIASANTLNMLFETTHDARMSRTKNRPLVRGLVSKRAALLFAIATGLIGTGMLWYGVNPTTSILGAANLGLYAFIYTPLKRLHPVNTWVGAVVGAIPPLMGWCAAASQYSTAEASGTSLWADSKELLFTQQAIGGWLLASILFAWQFPHFFALAYAVRVEYANAGYKMLVSNNMPMAARVSLRYSLAMFPVCFALTYYNVTDNAFVLTSSVINGWMLREAWRCWRLNGEKGSARALFWASVWQLPIVLGLAMVEKKGLWERIWRGVFGLPEGEEDDFDWEDEE